MTRPSWREVAIYPWRAPDVPARTPWRNAGPDSLRRENTLRAWAEGDARHVARVTDGEGHELAPADVDWSGMEPPPARRPGARVRTERGRATSRQVLVRLAPDEAADIERAAGDTRIATYIRDAALERARNR